MKKNNRLFLILILLFGNCYGAEINLICSGVEDFYSNKAGTKKIQGSIEVIFDDTLKKLISVNKTRLYGCYESDTEYQNSCDCKVTESSISCQSTSENKKKNFKSTQTVKINRVTGILSFGDVTFGEDFFISRAGDFSCDSYSKKKF